MFVALRGKQADGTSIERSWHLIAEGDDGPAIPAIPAAAIVRRCLESRPPASGAHSALYALDLRDFDPFFGKFAMVTGRRDTTCADTAEPLFQRLLGPAWNRLPPGLRAAHDVHGRKTFRGIADVERGNGILARCVAAVMRLPGAGTSIPVEVVFDRRERSEIWRRRFGEGVFQSHLSGGMGRSAHLLCERFGPVAVFLALVVDAERLHFVVRGWSFLGIPLPATLAPAGETYETAEDDALQFSVDITHRWLGRIVRYEGSLTHAREDAAVAST
jgi:hypothetical protein